MWDKLRGFFTGRWPKSVKWEEVREEILEACKNPVWRDKNIEFKVTDYYYKITSGRHTWYWSLEDGQYDGHSKYVGD